MVRWRWVILWFAIAFHMIAGVGCWRERHDVRVIQERFREQERQTIAKLEQVHVGDSLEKALGLFPNASTNLVDGTGEITFYPRTGYEENSSCSNVTMKTVRISTICGKVSRAELEGGPRKHMDRFALPTPWYYFKRAWYSSAVTRSPAWW
jgi:hypothetical protein